MVIHAAAKVTMPYTDHDPHVYEQVNHWGTAELSYAIEESNIQKLIHISSVSVYGSSLRNQTLDEHAKLNPKTNYSISKMRGEAFVERLYKKIPTYIVRLGNLYGFNQSMRFDAVINKFAFDANFLKKISIHGNGMQERAFINVDKASRIISELLVSNDYSSGVYNLVDFNKSVMDIALVFKEIYPDLEMQFINQHLKLRNLRVESKCLQSLPLLNKPINLKDEIQTIISQFAFN